MTAVARSPRLLYSSSRYVSGVLRYSPRPRNALCVAPQYTGSGAHHQRHSIQPSVCARLHSRSFTASSFQPTKAIVNPRKDENGVDMVIDIMPRAANRLHSIATTDNNPNLCLRVSVESGGCHGFQYIMSLTDTEKIDKEEDTLFESEDGKGARVVIDEPSLELLKGSKVDYTMELIGSQFKVTGIPGATSSCGCGSSFDVQV